MGALDEPIPAGKVFMAPIGTPLPVGDSEWHEVGTVEGFSLAGLTHVDDRSDWAETIKAFQDSEPIVATFQVTPELREIITGITEKDMTTTPGWETIPTQLVNPGDTIRVRGLEGEHVVKVDERGRYITVADGVRANFDNLHHVDRRVSHPSLPEKDGHYVDRDGDVWTVKDRAWFCGGLAGEESDRWSDPERLPDYAPFARVYTSDEVTAIQKESYARGRAAGAKKYEASKRHNSELEAIIGRRRDELMNALTLNAELQEALDLDTLLSEMRDGKL